MQRRKVLERKYKPCQYDFPMQSWVLTTREYSATSFYADKALVLLPDNVANYKASKPVLCVIDRVTQLACKAKISMKTARHRLNSLRRCLQGSSSSGQPAADASHDRVPRQSQGDTPSQARQGPQEGQSQRAKPRGLPSTVQSTVDRIAANTGPAAAVHSEISAESSSAMFAHAQATEEEEQVASVCCEADSGSASLGALVQGSPYGSPIRGPRGQGKPPLSPVRQSLQDLVLSHDSSPGEHALVPVSIAPVMGMPKQDMNVHCNPLFTDPLAGQPDAHDSPAQKQIADRSDLSHVEQHQQHQKKAVVSASAGEVKVAGQRAVPSSPPSQLQRSLRAIMQQHADELEVCIMLLLSTS